MKFNNRVPQDFFCTSGLGQSNLAINGGSSQHAREMAGIADSNLLFYASSLLPIGSKEIRLPSRNELIRGAVLESIMAVSHAREGERATAGIIYGYLRNRQTGEDHGGLVCEYSGALPEESARVELERIFLDIYDNSYADKYDYHGLKFIVQSVVAEKRYATALVAICFMSATFNETISTECDRPFLDRQDPFEDANNIVIPVVFDATSSWLKGTELGPRAILHASTALKDFDIETGTIVSEKGFHTLPAVTKEQPEKMLEQVQRHVARALKAEKIPCVIGGNHTVSLGAFRAVMAEYPDVSILHLDAHTDYYDEYQGSKYSHSCVVKRMAEQCENIVSVGIRSTSLKEKNFLKMEKIFYATDLRKDYEEWSDEITHQLDPEVYVTIDLDVFDPSVVGAVSTPEPGGLSWDFVTTLLKRVAKHHRIVGFDVVELCPNRHMRASDFTAAKLIYTTFAYINQYTK